jgi:hypothetical protein
MIHKERSLPGQLLSVFFGSRKAAVISSLFGVAVIALLSIAYLQVQEAAHIELPTGQVEKKIPNPQWRHPRLPRKS